MLDDPAQQASTPHWFSRGGIDFMDNPKCSHRREAPPTIDRRRAPAVPRRRPNHFAPAPEDSVRLAQVRLDRGPPPGPSLRFLWIGQWVAHKGTARLMRFMVQRTRRHPEDRSTLAGCGPDAAGDLLQDLAGAGTVRIVESFSRDDLPALLASHDVGLFTSDVEGRGVSLCEMLESGLPVFATQAGAMPDLALLTDGALRRFSPPDDLTAATLPAPANLGRYLEMISWDAVVARYVADLMAALQPPCDGRQEAGSFG